MSCGSRFRLWVKVIVVVVFVQCLSATAQDTGANKDWVAIGGGPGSLHYSKLEQINRENVKNLKVAWTFDTGDAVKGIRTEFESTPLEVKGVLYLISPKVRLFALNASTGKQI